MCDNKVSFYVPRGNDYREIFIRCGNTDPYGGRAICDQCRDDQDKMDAIEAHERAIEIDNQAAHSAGYGDY